MARRRPLGRWPIVARRIPLLLAVSLLAAVLWRAWSVERPVAGFEFRDGRIERVRRVTDDLVLELDSGVRMRLIGILPPERDRDRAAAVGFLGELVAGREIEVHFDRERIDRRDRVLALAYRAGGCVNERMIATGHARFDRDAPFRSDLQRSFGKAEDAARAAGLGLWSAE